MLHQKWCNEMRHSYCHINDIVPLTVLYGKNIFLSSATKFEPKTLHRLNLTQPAFTLIHIDATSKVVQ